MNLKILPLHCTKKLTKQEKIQMCAEILGNYHDDIKLLESSDTVEPYNTKHIEAAKKIMEEVKHAAKRVQQRDSRA